MQSVPKKVDGAVRPLRCRSASTLRPIGDRGHVAVSSLQTRTSSSSSTLPTGSSAVALAERTRPPTAWLSNNGADVTMSSGAIPQKQFVGTDAVAVGTGLQAARSSQYRKRLAEVIHSDLLNDHNLLRQAVSHGALPEFPPGFSRSLSPPPHDPVPKVSLARRDASKRCTPNLVVEGFSKASPHETSLSRPAYACSPDVVATDPNLRVEPLSEWIRQSPMIRGISAQTWTSMNIAEIWNVGGVFGQAAVPRVGALEKPKESYWQELFNLAENCRLPMPQEGTPEDLKIWALKLQERVGKRRWAAFNKRMRCEKTDYSWKPSRKSKTNEDGLLPKHQNSISESPTSKSMLDLPLTQKSIPKPSSSSEDFQQAWWPEISAENSSRSRETDEVNDDPEEGDSRLDEPDLDPPSTQRTPQKETDMNKQDLQVVPSSTDVAEKTQESSESGTDDATLDNQLVLFRQKDVPLDITAGNGIFPPGSMFLDESQSPKADDGKAVMSHTIAVADGSLAAMFRSAVAEAWEPSNIQAILESKRNIAEVEQEDEASEPDSPPPLRTRQHRMCDISFEDTSHAVAAYGGGQIHMDESLDHLSDLVCQRGRKEGPNQMSGDLRRVLARRDGYRRRFNARANNAVPSNRKWSQRVNNCRHSLRSLESLSFFADYNCRHLKGASVPAAA